MLNPIIIGNKMKKVLLSFLCISILFLVACDKKVTETNNSSNTNNTSVSSIHLSHNVISDIRNDLSQIQTLSDAKTKEALTFQNEVTQAAQQGDQAALNAVVVQMGQYVESFNQDLEALKIKSSEADSLRKKMEAANSLGLELAQAGIKTPPDLKKLNVLQDQATDLQQSLQQQMQSLQAKTNTK